MRMTLETERLLLRPFVMEDAPAMYEGWASDEEVTKYLTWNVHDSVNVTRCILDKWIREYKKPERLNFAIVLKKTGELIGGIDVVGYLGGVNGTPVIGYSLSRKHWNNGYMSEACKALLEHLFSLDHEEVRIDAMVENKASNRVIEKCGGILQCTEEEERPLKNDKVMVNRYLVRKEDR